MEKEIKNDRIYSILTTEESKYRAQKIYFDKKRLVILSAVSLAVLDMV